MSGKNWLGGIYLRQGGYNIVLRALDYYKNKVDNVGSDPQMKETPITLRSLIVEEGKKTSKKIQVVTKIIQVGLNDPKLIQQIQFEIPIIQKALNSYKTDIEKIVKNMEERYSEIFDEPKNLQDDLPLIEQAIKEINKFS